MKRIATCSCIFFAFMNVLVSETVSYKNSDSLFDRGLWPENYEVRRDFEAVLKSRTEYDRFTRKEIHRQSEQEHRVRIEARKAADAEYLLFLNEVRGEFPIYGRGSYIFKRSLSGDYQQAKIFLGQDEGCFIRLFPDGDRTRMDIYLFEKKLYGGVIVPLGFDRILTEPFDRIVRLTEKSVDWELVAPIPESGSSERVASFVGRIRLELGGLHDADDGAMDANGSFVFIESGARQDGKGGFNCSGFAKWIADGILNGLVGSFFTVAELKRPHSGLRGNRWSEPLEGERDPYFGLDWTRNIAVGLREAQNGMRGKTTLGFETTDVRDIPFVRYVEDVGFPVRDIASGLYYLAVTDPGNFYIASVNREFGKNPVLRQHTHVALLFPFFTEDGKFKIVVLERNVETEFSVFAIRNEGYDLHLVKVRVPETFMPPAIE